MARPRKAKPPPSPPKAAVPALGEALLLATVCMVGLPVEVQVRDGSAYAGVLHTACVDAGYGIVLKKARKIANGKGHANLPMGALVDTLVVQPDDLVQVIAKDLSLPIKALYTAHECNVVAESGSVKPQVGHANDQKTSKSPNISPLKQDQQGNTAGHVRPCLSTQDISSSATVGLKVGGIAAPMVTSDVKSTQSANNSAVKIFTSSKTTAKEFKLNPSAKVFSPSFTSSRQVLAAATPVNSNYMSHSATKVPTGIPVFEPKSVPGGSSLSSKVHYSNLSHANYGISPQYVQSMVGHNAARLDPAKVGTPYYPMQAGATYSSPSPSPPSVVAGKFSPVVYVHPISQDAMEGAPVVSQGWPHPVLLNTYQASLQKFQGNNPVYVAPPVMTTGNLPFVLPSPAPLVQPFQAIHPIMVPAASSMVPGKYM